MNEQKIMHVKSADAGTTMRKSVTSGTAYRSRVPVSRDYWVSELGPASGEVAQTFGIVLILVAAYTGRVKEAVRNR